MERAYNYISLFFLVILFVVLWGFSRTYILFFPDFKGFAYIDHIHGFLMLSWILMLIVQPLLIRAKKIAIHRTVGKLSYFLVPLILLSIFLAAKTGYNKDVGNLPIEQALGKISLTIPPLIAFAVLYGFAIANKKRPLIHMRYMLATSLLMISPGLGRALITYFNVPFSDAVTQAYYLAIGIAAILLTFDIINQKPLKPYTVTLLSLLFLLLAWQFRLTTFWLPVEQTFASLFF